MLPVTDCDKCWPLFQFCYLDQHWHYLYLSSAREKDLSKDTQIKVIIFLEPEIFMKMFRNLHEKQNLLRIYSATACL